MKRVYAFAILALLGSAPSARAQTSPYRDTGIKSQIDWIQSPEPGTVVLAGWAFNCTTQGQQPWSVRVYYLSQTDLAVHGSATVAVRRSGLKRKDVAAAFTQCGGPLNPYTGYQLTVSGVPPGKMLISLEWADSIPPAIYNEALVEVQ